MKKRQPKNKETSDKRDRATSYSRLDQHERRGSKLLTPFNAKLGSKMSLSSWRDQGMHEMLWAVIIRGNFSQEESLRLFRLVIIRVKESQNNHKDTFITHSVLSVLSDEDFDNILHPVIAHEGARQILSALLFFDCLPDRHHWERHLKEPDPSVHSEPLMRAVSSCLDHQSQEATDIRWFKLIYFIIVCERLQTPNVEELRRYPDHGDQRAVRPTIRAAEIMLRMVDEKSGLPNEVPPSLEAKVPKPWHEQFWEACLRATPCLPLHPRAPAQVNLDHYRDQFVSLLHQLSENFVKTLTNTHVDARRDSTFGLCMYGLVLCLGLLQVHQRAEGRVILRTIVEIYITLKFLSQKDDPTLWMQFRNYGNGQAKLSFLKNLRDDDLPSFASLEELEMYAGEDIWQEFQDIDLKSWSNRNLRSMAEEAGVKGIYDKYYDWSSGYVHGNWASIRDTIFTTCANPLHRFHRIPFIPRIDMPTALPDAAKLINSSLDALTHLFPPFKQRIKHPEAGPAETSGETEETATRTSEPEQDSGGEVGSVDNPDQA